MPAALLRIEAITELTVGAHAVAIDRIAAGIQVAVQGGRVVRASFERVLVEEVSVAGIVVTGSQEVQAGAVRACPLNWYGFGDEPTPS